MNDKPRLEPKPPRNDPDRRPSQQLAREALMRGTAFGVSCLLAAVRDRQPYSNYALPDTFPEFAFTLKGLLRLEMMNAGGNFAKGRRLFGATTRAALKNIRRWRSRAFPLAFEHAAAARAHLEKCPLGHWCASGRCPLLQASFPDKDWLVLLQIDDVWLDAAHTVTFAQLMMLFLREGSRTLRLVADGSCLRPPSWKGGGDG
jgi:hypothetical protein